eukprot:sb/3468843/
MDRLDRRYWKFEKGANPSFDATFIKEIMDAAKKTSKNVTPSDTIPKADANWKTPRIKIVKEFVSGRIRCRYGVGVRFEPPKVNPKMQKLREHLGNNMPGFWLNRAIESGKKDSTRSEEEHLAIVHSACAKLRERSNSRVSKKNLEQLRKYLPQIAEMGKSARRVGEDTSGRSSRETSPRVLSSKSISRPSTADPSLGSLPKISSTSTSASADRKESVILPAITRTPSPGSSSGGRRTPGRGRNTPA